MSRLARERKRALILDTSIAGTSGQETALSSRALPAEPMERIDPALPIERIEPALPMLRIEPALPMLRIEPALNRLPKLKKLYAL